jgi:uncharacterized paraquat-inducible protein A
MISCSASGTAIRGTETNRRVGFGGPFMMAKARAVQIVCPRCHFVWTMPVPKSRITTTCPKCGSEIEGE